LKKKPAQVYLSPTGLLDAVCPAKLWFTQHWQRRKEDDNFGSQVHRHMKEGTDFDPKKDFPSVEPILRKLRDMEASLGYTVLGREVEQVFELFPDVWLKRIMDAIVRMPAGKLMVVDYKSSSKPWKVIMGSDGEDVAPKAKTLQGTGYLLPSFESLILGSSKTMLELSTETWPTQAMFINAPASGDARWFLYNRNAVDEGNFVRLAHYAAQSIRDTLDDAGALKNRGDHCDGRWTRAKGQEYGWACPWLEMCYDQPNWKKLYKRRKR